MFCSQVKSWFPLSISCFPPCFFLVKKISSSIASSSVRSDKGEPRWLILFKFISLSSNLPLNPNFYWEFRESQRKFRIPESPLWILYHCMHKNSSEHWILGWLMKSSYLYIHIVYLGYVAASIHSQSCFWIIWFSVYHVSHQTIELPILDLN